MWKNNLVRGLCVAAAAAAALIACASVKPAAGDSAGPAQVRVVSDGYAGPKSRVQLVDIALPDSLLALYPELREKRVGWGVGDRLVDALYETNRFTFVEDKRAVLDRIMQHWAMGQTGAVNAETAPAVGGIEAPEYLVYADVYDFAVGTAETLVGAASRSTKTTRVGIQVRLVSVVSSEFTPGSGAGEAEAVTGRILWAATAEEFSQSTVGKATQNAINAAVNTLVRRISK
jgi:curli biogenesis system outer membrane secretion channel CsgG